MKGFLQKMHFLFKKTIEEQGYVSLFGAPKYAVF